MHEFEVLLSRLQSLLIQQHNDIEESRRYAKLVLDLLDPDRTRVKTLSKLHPNILGQYGLPGNKELPDWMFE